MEIENYWIETQNKPFLTTDDIPELPKVNKEKWETFYVPILIKRGAIPKKDLKIGASYLGSCRNSETAVWNGECFVYKRTKFGMTYDEEINHFEDDDGFDLFVPIKEINIL
jgi:hypothetical protein